VGLTSERRTTETLLYRIALGARSSPLIYLIFFRSCGSTVSPGGSPSCSPLSQPPGTPPVTPQPVVVPAQSTSSAASTSTSSIDFSACDLDLGLQAASVGDLGEGELDQYLPPLGSAGAGAAGTAAPPLTGLPPRHLTSHPSHNHHPSYQHYHQQAFLVGYSEDSLLR